MGKRHLEQPQILSIKWEKAFKDCSQTRTWIAFTQDTQAAHWILLFESALTSFWPFSHRPSCSLWREQPCPVICSK